jgi:uncharacterized protein (DUF58 family)
VKLDHSTTDQFLEPKLLRALARLTLTSRRVVDGAMVGSHRSPMKGYSTEFADHREYVKGDDLKHLDWKVLSRTERYYIKRYEENTNLRAHLIVDCSASMAYPRRPKAGQMSKYDYACHLAAGLAYVLIRQQDSVGLLLFNDDLVANLPPMRSLPHLRRILRTMTQVVPSSRTDAGKALHGIAGTLRRRGLLILISDLLDDPEKISRALAHFRQRGHDAIVIQVLDETELKFPIQKTSTFRDMETFRRLTVNGAEVAAEYSRQLDAFLEQVRKGSYEQQFDYVLASTATPYESLLTALLTRRQR